MKTRLLAIGLAVISAALVACGGGGGGGNPTPPVTQPSTAPTATPTSTPTSNPNPFGCVGQAPFIASTQRRSMSAPRPIASGDTLTYNGQLSQTYAQGAPCPQPTSTTSATITSSVSDTATTAPGGGSATLSTTSESDAYPTHTSSVSTASIVQISSGKLLLYSTTSSDGLGNSVKTAYNSAQEIDDLGTGGSWTFDPSAQITETLADGSSVARTTYTDGSYTDTQTYTNGTSAVATINGAANAKTLDGSGSYAFAGATFAYAAPAAGNITLTITSGSSSKTRTFPSWFTIPAGGLVSDTFADNGSKPFDGSCSVPGSIGTSGTQIVETYNAIDPVLGYTETRTTTSYDVAGYGPACVTIADTVNGYYDYSLDTTKIDYQSQNGQPNSVNTISETLSVQSETCGSGSPPCAQLRRTEAQPVSAARVAAGIAAIQHYRAIQRAQRLNSLRSFALHLVHQGAVR